MSDIRQWLDHHDLGQLADVFEREQIDLDAIRAFTEEDLKDLGLAIGLRSKLRAALQVLRSTAASNHPDGHIPRHAERRQLTVLFCDLVGSTQMSRQLDPERLRELMQSYQQACRNVIEKYDGHVAQYLGDGLMAYFGWPRAHEDDAERAVRTALELIEAVKEVAANPTLEVRIGVATGPVVVGETGEGDASVPKLAVGETPNLAARLQGLAAPDEIVISSATHHLLRGTFEYRDLGQHNVKGIVDRVHAWKVLGMGHSKGRFDAAHDEVELTHFVGRESEIALLLDRWKQVSAGEGQVVLLGGEPGIGKSRITQALHEHIAGQSYARVQFQCSPFHTQSALHPVIEQIEVVAGFQRDDSVERKLDKLESLLQRGAHPIAHVAPLFAHMLSLPIDRYPPLNYSPQKQKDLLLQALTQQIVGVSKEKPVLMVFEDAHWVDPTTHEALDLLVPLVAKLRVMLLVTYRPEYIPRWSGEAHLTTLTVNRFNARMGARLADRVTRGKALPKEVLEQIVTKTDGIPLFVEELTKTVLESGLLRETETHYELDGPLPALAIPSTLRDSLMARLDRLVLTKDLAQIGAGIGREFSYELIAAVSGIGDKQLTEGLEQLVQAQLIFQHGAPPHASYIFKHALIRDAAYESLLKSKRHALHKAIAEALQTRFSEMAANEPDVLAHHYTEAELDDQATTYWIAAARRAVERFANAEAIGYVDRGLRTLKALPAGTERDQKELLLQVNLGTALGSSKGFTPPEVGQAFARARDLCERVGQTPQMLVILDGLWVYYVMRADYDTSGQIDDQILDLARRTNDSAGLVAGHQSSCGTALFRGEFERAVEQGDKGWAAYNEEEHKNIGAVYSRNPAIVNLDFSAWALLSMGFLDRAVERHAEAVRLAMKEGYPLTIATVTAHAAVIHYLRDDAQSTLDVAQQVIARCKESGILIRQTEGEMLEGWALAVLGDTERGIPQLEAALNMWNMIGAQIANPLWYSCLSRAYQKAGRMDEARSALQKGIEYVEKNHEGLVEAEVRRLDGELRLAIRQDDPAAEPCLRKAIKIAKAQKAKLFELRASVSLAKLWRSQSKRREAHDLLAPIYNWFTEGFDTKDLKAAKTLLDELNA